MGRRTATAVIACASSASGFLAVSGMIPSRDAQQTMSMQQTMPATADSAPTLEGGSPPPQPPQFDVTTLPGVTAPLGFFDPAGFSKDASEGKIRFYREVEIKHARVAMLAALGFPVAEQFHPLFGGNLDVPSYISFQETPLQSFWPVVVLLISTVEVYSVFSFNSPFNGETWSVRSDHEPGNLGWDPLNLKPTDPSAFKEMATKELNNGRLAMIGAAGMIAQELASGDKLFN